MRWAKVYSASVARQTRRRLTGSFLVEASPAAGPGGAHAASAAVLAAVAAADVARTQRRLRTCDGGMRPSMAATLHEFATMPGAGEDPAGGAQPARETVGPVQGRCPGRGGRPVAARAGAARRRGAVAWEAKAPRPGTCVA